MIAVIAVLARLDAGLSAQADVQLAHAYLFDGTRTFSRCAATARRLNRLHSAALCPNLGQKVAFGPSKDERRA